MTVDLLARLRTADPGTPRLVSTGPIEQLYQRALGELVEHCAARATEPAGGAQPT